MKLISLNLWGGKQYESLMDFIKGHSNDTDIFCFQEVFNTNTSKKEAFGFRLNLLEELPRILPNHQAYFAPCVDNYIAGAFQPNFTDFNLSWGLAIFVRKDIEVETTGDFFVYRQKNQFDPLDLNTLPRNLQYITFEKQGKKYLVSNLHGIWLKGGKNDHPTRISQSEQIIDFLKSQNGRKILAGDFNLNMDTKSIKILEKNMKNLIKKYNIPTTRNKFYPGPEPFADYTFVSSDINVLNFEVPNLEISDHLPMILEFS